jgi:hypothetical protein
MFDGVLGNLVYHKPPASLSKMQLELEVKANFAWTHYQTSEKALKPCPCPEQ